ncbi:hypothetical protein HK104_011074 [Borealophlyctis nickersoniae]|nr:hypothetical protein HK104_011074 [Borealophlyctis nickersoniae]
MRGITAKYTSIAKESFFPPPRVLYYTLHVTSFCPSTIKNHYQILNVPKTADKKAIKAAFYKLSMKYHPDKNPNDETAKAKFLEISDAYSTLSDDSKRQQYDRSLNVPPSPGPSQPHAHPHPHSYPHPHFTGGHPRTGPSRPSRPAYRPHQQYNPSEEDWDIFGIRKNAYSRPTPPPDFDFAAYEAWRAERHAEMVREARRRGQKPSLWSLLFGRGPKNSPQTTLMGWMTILILAYLIATKYGDNRSYREKDINISPEMKAAIARRERLWLEERLKQAKEASDGIKAELAEDASL